MAGTLTVAGLVAGVLTGQNTLGPITMTGSTTVDDVVQVTLASGDNSVSVPAGATAALIVLPATNAVQLKLRTNLNSSDGGTPFGPTGYAVLPLYAGTTSVIVNAASSAGTLAVAFI